MAEVLSFRHFFVYLYEVQLLLQSIHVSCCCVMQWIFVSSGSYPIFQPDDLVVSKALGSEADNYAKIIQKNLTVFVFGIKKRSA